ncbi:MAG: DNA-binding transcriptional regulator [Planctomycetaceae bacterium]|jgi:LacI family transcriptional regulator|nr:DNA-binding transcriptional regulator [Planctomycetaceae bacterium]
MKQPLSSIFFRNKKSQPEGLLAVGNNVPKVAILIETSREYGRGLLRGIAQYSQLYGPWQFHLTPGDFEQIVPKMKEWGGKGIIARVMNDQTAQLVIRTGLPTVFLDLPDSSIVRKIVRTISYIEMVSDSVGAAELVAEHFLEKQFRQFAYVGYQGQIWSHIREQAFTNYLKNKGFSVEVYRVPLRNGSPVRWEKEEVFLARWLVNLPKPIALMACNDQRGREVLDACSVAKIVVPEEMAVVGVDNDELLCELSYPPLSSVQLNTEQGGFLAAQALDKMMKNQPQPLNKIIVVPLRVVERRSSNVVAVDDPLIAASLQYIHTQPLNTLTIHKLAEHLAVSRRGLELKFRRILGVTVLQEIHKVRLDRAKRLLQETDMTIPEIADDVGFATGSYFIQVFKNELGITPSKYRQIIRNG